MITNNTTRVNDRVNSTELYALSALLALCPSRVEAVQSAVDIAARYYQAVETEVSLFRISFGLLLRRMKYHSKLTVIIHKTINCH